MSGPPEMQFLVVNYTLSGCPVLGVYFTFQLTRNHRVANRDDRWLNRVSNDAAPFFFTPDQLQYIMDK